MVIFTPQKEKRRKNFRRKIGSLLRYSFVLLVANLLFNFSLSAQAQTYTGVVTGGSDGLPIPGANVIIKGTTTGTITNIDGEFSISADVGSSLMFTFIGYNTEEVVLGNETKIAISLIEDISKLDEVVVIGYGVQKKKLITGATAQVKGDDLKKQNQTNALQAMQGKTSGVNITSSSGQPGEDMRVIIRGTGTINNANPLYIVDGVQVGDIKYLNNADIESIDVLKDAASCAIYGSQGANGVILVTTKQGKEGKAQVSFDSYYGIQNRYKKVDLLNAEEYAMIMNEQHLNEGKDRNSLPYSKSNLRQFRADGPANTDWLDEMFEKNTVVQNYNLGVTGGSETSVYSLSIGFTGQEGIVGGKDVSNYERINARLNTEHKLYNGRVKFGQHMTFANTKKNGIGVGDQYGNSLRSAFNTSPLIPVYDDNGDYFDTSDESIIDMNASSPTYGKDVKSLTTQGNPYGSLMVNNQNNRVTQNFLADIYSEIEVVRELKLRSTFGVDYSSEDYRSFTPIYQFSVYSKNESSKVTQNMSKNMTWNIDNVLTYNFRLSEHKFDLMAGSSIRSYKGVWMNGSNLDLAYDDFEHAYLSNATNQKGAGMEITGAPNDENKMLSYFGRVQYNFKETYMLNMVFRADGSSKFAKGHRWGFFPSVSGGWVISNENFMASASNFLNFLKLRASWGQNGNSNIEAFRYLALLEFTNATYPTGTTEGDVVNGSYPRKLGNDDIKWETSEQTDIGFDARLFDSHLSVEFDWYNKSTKDWLIEAPVPATGGAAPPYINGGNVNNRGVELNLGYRNSIGDFNYNVSVNGSYNKNEVTDIPNSDGIVHGATNSLYNNSEEFYRAQSGYPIGYFWGYETNGIFQSTAEINDYLNTYGKTLQSKPEPGDVRFVDTNNDGVIDEEDKTQIGDPSPDFTYGFSISLDYKAFDFSLAANGVIGNQIVQSYRSHTDYRSNYTTAILDRWNPENQSNSMPRVTEQNTNWYFSDLYIQDGDFLRINNVTLGFDLVKLIKIEQVSQLRFYASIQNLYTFTKYDGMDPEVGYGLDNGSTDKFSSGVDLGFYPRPRTILFGVNVKF